jgi:glyoxylase-like metal-dependent hydrolase (beta-lactamase superfamily II)
MFSLRIRRTLLATLLSLAGMHAAVAAEPLALTVYNPGSAAIFPVSSVLVSGKRQAILVDAQFGKAQAEQLVAIIRASGKQLSTIYISHGDPDYYFGLDTIKAAFPEVRVVATAQTVAHIRATSSGKLAFWGPKLQQDAPGKLIIPEVLNGHSLTLEGKTLEIMGLNGAQPERSYVWIPSIKAVVGGVVLANNLHVWMADTQSTQSHRDWLTTLQSIADLKPKTVVPGHFLPGQSSALQSVAFTTEYIQAFDAETSRATNSSDLVHAMQTRFPTAGELSSLELSAKVAKGEMKW